MYKIVGLQVGRVAYKADLLKIFDIPANGKFRGMFQGIGVSLFCRIILRISIVKKR